MSATSFVQRHWLVGSAAIVLVALAAIGPTVIRSIWPPSEALHDALKSLMDGNDPRQALVATVVWTNFEEARNNARNWSGAFFGCSFAAAALSAIAGLILKFEFFVRNDALKKDLAAICSVLAAILVTISTSGDFQRKWQANRIAAADLERVGYQLLEDTGRDPRHYLTVVHKTLHDRNLAIVGATPGQDASKSTDQEQEQRLRTPTATGAESN